MSLPKIPPDLTDENPTTAAYTSFNEILAAPSIQVIDDLPVHRAGYCLLSNSLVFDYSEHDPYCLPDMSYLHPDHLQFPGDCDTTQCPQLPFLSSNAYFSSSELQVDLISSNSTDKTRNNA